MCAESYSTFSKRYGFVPKSKEITIREEAPEEFRYAVIQRAFEKTNLCPRELRDIVCGVLLKRPNLSNWSDSNIYNEVFDLVGTCDWNKIYDIIEAILDHLNNKFPANPFAARDYEKAINECFIDMGIGWKLEKGRIEFRGEETFEIVLKAATQSLNENGLNTAKQELTEALQDLSRRPEPDLSGAIQHSMASLECLAREVTGDKQKTLGAIIKQYPGLLPKVLDDVISKIWGYSSEVARHRREGQSLDENEVILVVGLVSTIVTYLCQRLKPVL
jgi:hypothetical protein